MSRFAILMYHMVSEPRSEKERRYACPPALFVRHMAFLRGKGFNVIGLDTIHDYMTGTAELPPNSVAVTLDDGFRDNYENAFPVLQRFDIPATIFLATGMIGGVNSWMRTENFHERAMLTWGQITEMSGAGITFGAHTINHPRLPELGTDEACREIVDSRKAIEDRLGKAVRHFAYPYGLFSKNTRDMVEKIGYDTACSTRSGFNTREVDRYLLRRTEVYGGDPVWKLSQKLTFGTNDAGIMTPLRYYWDRARVRMQRR